MKVGISFRDANDQVLSRRHGAIRHQINSVATPFVPPRHKGAFCQSRWKSQVSPMPTFECPLSHPPPEALAAAANDRFPPILLKKSS
jgi:hypothetical protein